MTKKKLYAFIKTEVTVSQKVVDFAMVVCNREGLITNMANILVNEHFDTTQPLSTPGVAGLESKRLEQRKRDTYIEMVANGNRTIAGVWAVNRWIGTVINAYQPTLVALDLALESDRCRDTGIELSGFREQLCLKNALHEAQDHSTRLPMSSSAITVDQHFAMEDIATVYLPILKATLLT